MFLLLSVFLSSVTDGTLVVNAAQSSYQAVEGDSVTLEWTFTTTPDGTLTSLFIHCELFTGTKVLALFQFSEGVEAPETQNQHFKGRVRCDMNVIRDGRIRLHLSTLRASDSGQYVCYVKTGYGSTHDTCRLGVSALQVIGGNVTVSSGADAVLPCRLVETSESLTQISWQMKTRQHPVNDNFCTILQDGPRFFDGGQERFTFVGDFKDRIGSLQLSEVTLGDEGTYTCIFTLYPSGNHKTEVPLNVFVAPVSSLQDLRPALGEEEVPLVTCTAARSKPPAEVSWITGDLPVRATTDTTHHADGTTTTVSSLLGVPTLRLNGEEVQCVVSTEALKGGSETLTHVLQVYFAPTDVQIEAQDKDSFQCVTKANPSAEFNWERLGGSWPRSGVKVDGAKLQFLSMTADQSGLYQCDASNTAGSKRGYLYVHVPSGSCSACWTLFSLLLLLLVCAAAGFYLYKSGRCSWISRITNRDRQEVPTNSPHEAEGRRAESEGL